ncbi:RNA polymerase II-associated protein 1 isoform 1 [Camelus ferus]|nr:RNA polymerase II-associated protein 1 isoform 1 [Camelus ferus]
MLSRPKPGESEVDLLRFQSQFLATGAAPAVQLVKKGSRRGGDANLDQPLLQKHRDVVMLDSEWLWGAWSPVLDPGGLHSVPGKSWGLPTVFRANGIREEGQKAQFGRGNKTDCTLLPGKGLRTQEAEQEAQTIHEENIARLQAMAPKEILQEQQRLLAQLDPSLVAFLRSHNHTREQAGEKATEEQRPGGPPEVAGKEPITPPSASEPRQEEALEPEAPALALPVTPHKEWLHMDTVELEKLHWTQDLPPLRRQQTQERAGYSLQELFHLTRSQVSQQRALALHVLAQVICRAQAGEFGDRLVGSVLHLLLDAGFLFLLRFSLDDRVDGVIAAAIRALRALLVAPGDEELLDSTFSWYHGALVFPLMPSQEDREDEVEDEEPPAEKAKRKSPEEGNRPPSDLARHDVIKGLLATNLLPRLRYVLEVTCPGPSVVLDILAVLIRLARHSLESATRVLECPRLIETVVREFLPTSWSPLGVGPTPSLHQVPCAPAMKLLRVLASAGRNIAARLLSSFDLRSRLCRFIAEAPQELALPPEEAEMLSTEAFRLWAMAASYGQGGDLYRELYPVLMQALQAVPKELSTHPPQPLALQRIASLLTLLTQLTLAASSTALEPSSDSAEASLSATTSLITWTQVSGLQPLVEPCLRQTLKLLPKPEMWSALGPVPTACLLFLDAYYQAWSQQWSFQEAMFSEGSEVRSLQTLTVLGSGNRGLGLGAQGLGEWGSWAISSVSFLVFQPGLCPGDWLQDMERLSEELLLPLLSSLSQPALGSLWDSLGGCSPLCNPQSSAPAPEALPSLVSLGCTGGRPPLSLAGSASPFPFLTALLSLFNTMSRFHKGLCGQLAAILAAPGLRSYFLQCVAPVAAPHLTPFSAWALRHECHLQYLALSLAQKAATLQPVSATDAALHHSMALALLSRLLPGSEHLAHELLLSCVFRLEFLPERASGGLEAADFSDRLSLGSGKDLGLLASQALHRGELRRVPALLLPVPKEPLLPTDWPFLPLIHLYHRASDTPSGLSPADTVGTAMRALQWVLVLESWRPQALWTVPPAARLARLMCVFLVDSELFRETPIQRLVAALLARLCQPEVLPNLKLDCPLPGLTSFPDLYANFLEHFEAVSFGDHLFGALVLLPLQRRFSVTLRLALFGEHVGALRALALPLTQLPVSLDCYTGPPEDNLALLQLYFRALVTGALRPRWCPVLYAVAVAHVNSFIFSQDPKSSDEVKAARKSMLQKTWLLPDEGLRQHLLHYKLPDATLPEGFEQYPQLPPLRQQYVQKLISGVLQNGVSETVSAYGAAGGKGAKNHLSRAHGVFVSAVLPLGRWEPLYIFVGQQREEPARNLPGLCSQQDQNRLDSLMQTLIIRAGYYHKGYQVLLPVKWMPPEALLEGILTSYL